MQLRNLLDEVRLVEFYGNQELEITGLSYSSKNIEPGYVFFALKGQKADGHDFLAEVTEKGASLVVSERPRPAELNINWLQVLEVREAMAQMAASFYGHPSLKLKTIGITGTKGKTTTSYLLEHILKTAGLVPGVMGTIEYRWKDKKILAERTTPESVDIQRILKEMVDDGVSHCVMEVSSHSLDLKRVFRIGFDLAIFTNLSGEHLDYHENMDKYFAAKKKLFFLNHKRQASIVNIDDPWGEKLIAELPMKTITYGFRAEAIIRAENFTLEENGMKATVSFPGGTLNLKTSLLGKHNLYNILAAISAALVLGVTPSTIGKAISTAGCIPGRFEVVPSNLGFKVVVDYAHTDAALENLLLTVKSLNPKRIILVFGCGGDRDRSKRPRMGEVAARMADWTILTSDNPRSEDPERIIDEIEQGFLRAGSKNYERETERRKAIEKALRLAKKGDFVLIAGKGHENYQIFRDKTIHFSDVEEAQKILQELEKK